MLKRLYLKIFSQLLLVVVLTLALNGVHESAHATCGDLRTAAVQATGGERSAQEKKSSPAVPVQHDQNDCGGCVECTSCACHAPLPVAAFVLQYSPLVLDIATCEPYQHLPEVYLSKFIPPQLKA